MDEHLGYEKHRVEQQRQFPQWNIYNITLLGSAILSPTKVTQMVQKWQNRPLERQYFIIYGWHGFQGQRLRKGTQQDSILMCMIR